VRRRPVHPISSHLTMKKTMRRGERRRKRK